MKKIISVILILLLLVGFNTSLYAEVADDETKVQPSITLSDGSSYILTGVDKPIITDSLIVYTNESGSSTEPFDSTTVQAIIVNDIVVEVVTDGAEGASIPSNGYTLSGSGSYKDLVESLTVGEIVTMNNLDITILPEKYFTFNGNIYPIDLVNGARGSAMTVLYDSSYGVVTDTNEWGLEIAIKNGQVTDIRYLGEKNPLAIPTDGFVLSIQSDSEYDNLLGPVVKVGDQIDISLENVVIYNGTRIKYDAMNPKTKEDNPNGWDEANNQPFPGFRGANQVIVYDSSYGNETGTNSFGYEFIVDANGMIVSTGGNNSVIPEDGYVISAHGSAIPVLMSAGILASTVSIDEENNEVVVIYTPQSTIDRAAMLIEKETANLEHSKITYKDVDYEKIQDYLSISEVYLEKAQSALSVKDYVGMKSATDKVIEETSNAHFTNFESRNVEMRAVWMRPTETTREAVQAKVNELKEVGVNAIYLETSNDRYTIYPSSSPYVSINPAFNGQDMLEIYIEEAHAAGIELHAWYKAFMVEPSVIEKAPDLSLETRDGLKYEPKTGYSWISPANQDARDYTLMMATDLVEKYDIDGLQLDYIRYPDYDMGYETSSIDPFIAEYGVDPRTLTEDDEAWMDWAMYRQSFVNTMVYEIFESAREINPKIERSASVWPQYDLGPIEKMQNPKDWIDKGYLDALFPMSYNIDKTDTVRDLNNTIDIVKDNAYQIFGVGSYFGLSHEALLEQMEAVNNASEGTAIFESSSFLEMGYGDRASQGIYSRTAITPENNPNLSVKLILNDISRKIDEIYLPLGGIDHRSAKPLHAQLDSLIKKTDDLDKLEKRLNQFLKKVQKDAKISPEVVARITTDIHYAQRITNKALNLK
ncbi:glycoside hydrolase family 10 protein [Oceanobacillus chungangensis]|uniref:Glycosyl hydrolase-like 10 domain-containing protein n=1 Tax=Oceanobacillus chungangensis TaxID=1229152 RepID=A0A3D8PX48_9BACI|nr:family 10 glycosylhydrolase [Oceanobacillus chungangensis]RDW20673.1 hypothetical protein CWR45_05455 [Oceanobacillus chungangensis]